ncbi:MAG: hypothetical protein CVV51_14120 [Spirochaetae bacterium HGW-Spirochaetae-7]|nr:MAG: hypothetical protein CVV51_14120 [Spirochaetae bacterium HGW-Spirochaetae-7]
MYLEYEVYKAVTVLSELVRTRALLASDVENVLAFGLYTPEGKSLTIYGSAPASMDPLGPETPLSRFLLRDSSVVLVRAISGDQPNRRMMMGTDRPGRMRGIAAPETQPDFEPGQIGQGFGALIQPGRPPALAYIEYSTSGFKNEEKIRLVTAAGVSLVLLGLYGGFLAMYGRYLASKDREARDRELVELGQAARTIAHEIKNPLGVIRLQCGILRRGADEATVAGLAVIDDEAVRLADLAERIRTYLKSGGGDLRTLEAARFVASFAGRYQGTLDVEMNVGPEAFLEIDEARVVDALDNIVSNALEASAETGAKPLLEARIRSHRLLVSILDRGPGIPPVRLPRLFEPFNTTKPKGSGLGLALARKNIEAFGGTVSYADRPGGGAIFTVSLPLGKPE